MVAVLTRTSKGCCNLLPDLLTILNNITKPASKQSDTSYTSCTTALTASWKKPSCGEYSSYYYTDISNISSHLASGFLLVSCWIVLNDNPLKYSPYSIRWTQGLNSRDPNLLLIMLIAYYILSIYFITELINRYTAINYSEYPPNIILRIGIGIITSK